MTVAFSTPHQAVDIVRRGKYRLEARHPATGRLLGAAVCSRGDKDSERYDWIGWYVRCGAHRSVVDTVTAARELLADLASASTDSTDATDDVLAAEAARLTIEAAAVTR